MLLKKTSTIFVCKMFKLRKEKMEKITNVLLQLSSNSNRMTGEIERQRLQSEKKRAVARYIRYDSGYLTCSKKLTGSQLSLPHVSHLSVRPSE